MKREKEKHELRLHLNKFIEIRKGDDKLNFAFELEHHSKPNFIKIMSPFYHLISTLFA